MPNKVMASRNEAEAKKCTNRVDMATRALQQYYQQSGASDYNLDEALDASFTLTKRRQKTSL